MESTVTDTVIQFIPVMFIQLVYASVVFIAARKRQVNPWFWTIASLVPAFGMIVSAVFMLLTFLSMLDRLNVLESKAAA